MTVTEHKMAIAIQNVTVAEHSVKVKNMTVADHNVSATQYIRHETEWLNKPPVTLTDYNVKVAKQNMTVAEHNVTVSIQQFSVQYTRQEVSRWKLRVGNMLPWHPLELLKARS